MVTCLQSWQIQIIIKQDSEQQVKARMEAFIANRQNEKLLKIYLLRSAYEVSRSLDKELSSSLASNCIIIRKHKIKNETEFGYKQSLKTGFIKKIHFVYLTKISDVITFLWAHLQSDKLVTAGFFIDGIEQYFGERFSFEQNGKAMAVVINLLLQLGEKSANKKLKIKTGFSYCFNPYVFLRSDFMNYMQSYSITCWEIGGKEILKNGHEYESEWTRVFLEQYSPTTVKEQAES